MHSTNIRQIKAALWDQAFTGSAWVWCSMGNVVAVRKRKGQLLAMIRGWGRRYPVESVRIEYVAASPSRRGIVSQLGLPISVEQGRNSPSLECKSPDGEEKSPLQTHIQAPVPLW